jgi:uncharacterized protein YjbI with pentapeptide repeats
VSVLLAALTVLINFDHRILVGMSFKKIQATQSSWRGAYLRHTDFSFANLEEANFQDCYAYRASFQNANLRRSNFSGCDLRFVDFRGADLRGADLSDALLFDALFQDSKLDEKTKLLLGEEGTSSVYE